MMNRIARWLRLAALLCWMPGALTAFAAEAPRQTIVRAILTEDDAGKRAVIGTLVGQGDEAIKTLLIAWRSDALFVYTAPDGATCTEGSLFRISAPVPVAASGSCDTS